MGRFSFLRSSRSRSGSQTQTLGNHLLRLRPHETVDQVTVFEDEHRGYARDLITSCGERVIVYVQFAYSVTPLRLGSKLIHNWADDPAWTTPRRPTVDEQGTFFRLHYFALECLVRNNYGLRITGRCARFQLCATAATFRLAGRQSSFVNAVLCFTLSANNYLHSDASFDVFNLSLPDPWWRNFCEYVSFLVNGGGSPNVN